MEKRKIHPLLGSFGRKRRGMEIPFYEGELPESFDELYDGEALKLKTQQKKIRRHEDSPGSEEEETENEKPKKE
jgi:hypothetical protein